MTIDPEEADDFEPPEPPVAHAHGDDCLWRLESHTEAKHRLYKRYFNAWAPIMLQEKWVNRVTYLEGFAGPGEYLEGQDGSPAYAIRSLLEHDLRDTMRISRARVTLIFLEKSRARCDHLRWRLEDEFGPLDRLPITVIVEQGLAQRDTIDVLARHGAWGEPILAIFDSWSSVRVPHTTISRIGRNRASEVIVTFGPIWFSRRETINQVIFDEVFGSREAWHRDSGDEGWRYWLETYKAALKRAGFEYPLNFEILPTSGHPLYLVYGTDHSRGVEEFKNAMWSVDRHDGMRFNDPRTNAARVAELERYQGDLLALLDGEPEDAPDKELRALILDHLEDGPTTLGQIRDWVLLETAYWRKSDATPAVEFLIDQGLVERVTGKGRITSPTLLRLVAGPVAAGTPEGG